MGHIEDRNNGPQHCKLGLVVRDSQGNSFSSVSASPRAKAGQASFILWSEFLFHGHPLRWSFFRGLTFYGNFRSNLPRCYDSCSVVLGRHHASPASRPCPSPPNAHDPLRPCLFAIGDHTHSKHISAPLSATPVDSGFYDASGLLGIPFLCC